MTPISWNNISAAVNFYKDLGYSYIETPWLVDKESVNKTIPGQSLRTDICNSNLSLVGSAEQGFIDLILNGNLEPGRYLSAGPCFRKEDFYDKFHQPQFFKVELVHYKETFIDKSPSLDFMIQDAVALFESLGGNPKIEDTNIGKDIYNNDIEVGSYGIRDLDNYGMICYGTGLAEPRFTVTQTNSKDNI